MVSRSDAPSPFPRSVGTARGQARRAELLELVTDDLAANGLADFSLRRAARAAGTTHKVLLYHFTDAGELLALGVGRLRERRIDKALIHALSDTGPGLAGRVRAIWSVLTGPEETPLTQAAGLAMLDPASHSRLVEGNTRDYLAALRAACPPTWSDQRRDELATLILAALRGLLLQRRTGADDAEIEAGLRALERVISREEAADPLDRK